LVGFQEATSKDERPVAERTATTTAPTLQPGVTTKAVAQPATATPRATLRAQQLATRKAKAAYEITRLTRELAEIAVEENEEVIYPRDPARVEQENRSAESEQTRSQDRLEWARRMFEKKSIPKAEMVAAEVRMLQARFTLEQARTRREVLVKYTRDKRIKENRSEVEKAQADERAKKETWDLEKAKETELERLFGLETN
jgi:hypothetical protein